MGDFIILEELLVKLSAILGASLMIERFLSILGGAMSRLFIVKYADQQTDLQKEKLLFEQDIKARKEEEKLSEKAPVDKNRSAEKDGDPEEIPYLELPTTRNTYKARNSDLLRIRHISEILDDEQRYVKYKENNVLIKDFWMQILGTMIAIFGCSVLGFSIWEFFEHSLTGISPEPRTFDYIFTGIIIGSGTKPMNFLMNFLLNRKIQIDKDEISQEARVIENNAKKENVDQETQTGTPPPVKMDTSSHSIEELVGFKYDEGDRPERLENTHIYTHKIDLIVYHHTCFHCDAPFEALVKEFDRKNWLTGYHCVVFKDGSIRVLCRWDRFGNHAKYHNNHSFGLAFQGNFETRPGIPASNPDGRLGITSPSRAQLESAARVIAMNALLHGIKFKFPANEVDQTNPAGIIPHRLIANKACPGNNFPQSEFEEIISEYHTAWKDDKTFKKALEKFKLIPRAYYQK